MPVLFYVFDVLRIGDRSLLAEPYDARRDVLAGLGLERLPQVGVPDRYVDVPAAQLLDVARAHGLEGIVSKRRGSRYQAGRRSAAWIKTPLLNTQEVLVGGWTAGQGRRGNSIGALLLGAYDADRQLRYLGRVGTGFTDTMLTDLADLLAPLAPADQPLRRAAPGRRGPRSALGAPRPGR